MKVDATFMDFLSREEGIRRFTYLDSNNVPTIGIGHKIRKSEKSSGKITINSIAVKYQEGLTTEQILALCLQDIKYAETCINGCIQVRLTQNQFNALVSFAFNVGISAFSSSTLRRKLNMGLYDEVPTQLIRWVYDGGKVVRGLINRRNAEIELWKS